MGLLGWLKEVLGESPEQRLTRSHNRAIIQAIEDLQDDVLMLRSAMWKLSGAKGAQVKYSSSKKEKDLQKALDEFTLEKNRDTLKEHGFKKAEVVMEWDSNVDTKDRREDIHRSEGGKCFTPLYRGPGEGPVGQCKDSVDIQQSKDKDNS